jgi:hypothetical protein
MREQVRPGGLALDKSERCTVNSDHRLFAWGAARQLHLENDPSGSRCG